MRYECGNSARKAENSMRVNFTDSQIEYISAEFGLSKEQLNSADDETFAKLYDDLCDIEVEETIKADDSESELSERGVKAEELVTMMGNAYRDS